jgi:hypothetical protein
MPELNLPVWIGIAAVVFAALVFFFLKGVPRAVGKQCPKCLRRVPKGVNTCPACGATVTTRTDIAK